MERLRLAGVTYLGSHPEHPDVVDDLKLRIDGSGVSLRRRVRALFSISWPAVTALDVLSPHAIEQQRLSWRMDFVSVFMSMEVVQARTSGSEWSVLELRTKAFTCWLLVPDRRVDSLRGLLASFASQAAGAGRRGGLPQHPVEQVHTAVGMWRAAGLGREPLTDRNTLAYRLAVAENHFLTGNPLEAIALLESLVAQSVETFGPADADTLNLDPPANVG